MRETPKIVSLATALAALVTPTAVPNIANAEDSDIARSAPGAEEGILPAQAEVRLSEDLELMSFTVHRASDGMLFPQHGSHSSHSSHSSHASHASSSGGYGGSGSDWPNPYVPPVYVPPVYVPEPAYVPPPAATTSPTTSPAPAAAADPAYLACTRASTGYGANDIASELGQVFGMSADVAVNIAQQALEAVFGGGHYCDGYLGDH